MVRIRTRCTLSTLMVVVLAQGLNLAWVPWPGSGVVAFAIVIPVVVSGLTLIEWMVTYSIVGVLLGLLMPAVTTDCRSRNAALRVVAPAPSLSNVGPTSPEGPDEPNG